MGKRTAGKELPQERLLQLCQEIERKGIEVWLDGGWGVDALLGEQTRPHGDVDVVVQGRDVQELVAFLRSRGYEDVPQDDTRSWNFVLGDATGCEVDIHVITMDDNGNGIYGPPENGQYYPAEALSGRGRIGGRAVRCMTPEYQVANRSGYVLQKKDISDVRRLCRRFELPMPDFAL